MLDTRHAFKDEYFFLSNMYPCTIESDGKTFNSSEQLYQYLKIDPTEVEWLQRILEASPRESKKIIREEGCPTRQFSNRKGYDVFRIEVMKYALRKKFEIPELKEKLLSTGDMHLVEYNWWHDTFFGVCENAGRNHLGILLMQIRSEHQTYIW